MNPPLISGDYGLEEIQEQSIKSKNSFMQSTTNRVVSLTGAGGGNLRESAYADFYLDTIARDQLDDFFLLQVNKNV